MIKCLSTWLPIFHKTYFILSIFFGNTLSTWPLGHWLQCALRSFEVFLETVIRISLSNLQWHNSKITSSTDESPVSEKKNHFFSDRCKMTFDVSRYCHKASELNFPCSYWTCLMKNIFFYLDIYGSILLFR